MALLALTPLDLQQRLVAVARFSCRAFDASLRRDVVLGFRLVVSDNFEFTTREVLFTRSWNAT